MLINYCMMHSLEAKNKLINAKSNREPGMEGAGEKYHREIFQKHIIGKVNGNLINPINKSINGKAEFFPFMENLE